MPHTERSSDVVEVHWENALSFGFLGIASLIGFAVLYRFQGEGTLIGLCWVLFVFGVGLLGYAVRRAVLVRKVITLAYTCPYCEGVTELTEIPRDDYSCLECGRMVPIVDGEVIQVHQVRCGYCGELNYFSEKTDFLICEKCNHEIPIHSEGPSDKAVPKYYVVVEDDSLYELVLVAFAPGKTEELIDCLQHMLAVNRTQVKSMLQDLPTTLLTGITRRKAEMLQAQLSVHDAAAEARSLV